MGSPYVLPCMDARLAYHIQFFSRYLHTGRWVETPKSVSSFGSVHKSIVSTARSKREETEVCVIVEQGIRVIVSQEHENIEFTVVCGIAEYSPA